MLDAVRRDPESLSWHGIEQFVRQNHPAETVWQRVEPVNVFQKMRRLEPERLGLTIAQFVAEFENQVTFRETAQRFKLE